MSNEIITISKTKLQEVLLKFPASKNILTDIIAQCTIDNSNNKTQKKKESEKKESEEDRFWNNPTIIEFDCRIFYGYNGNNNSWTNQPLTKWSDILWMKSKGRGILTNKLYVSDYLSHIYLTNKNYDSSGKYINYGLSGSLSYTIATPHDDLKLFYQKYIKLLSREYSTIKSYVIFWRYWIDESFVSDKTDTNYYVSLQSYYLIPENKFYSDLPFMRKYSKYLSTIGERKGYKIQVYAQYINLGTLMINEVTKYVYEKHYYEN